MLQGIYLPDWTKVFYSKGSNFFLFTQHSNGSTRQSSCKIEMNKRMSNWKIESQSITVCRWFILELKKSKELRHTQTCAHMHTHVHTLAHMHKFRANKRSLAVLSYRICQ